MTVSEGKPPQGKVWQNDGELAMSDEQRSNAYWKAWVDANPNAVADGDNKFICKDAEESPEGAEQHGLEGARGRSMREPQEN